MPKRSPSGTRGLIKRHARECTNRQGDPARCRCAWSGRHKKREVVLAKWAGIEIGARDKGAALVVFTRMKAAVDARDFDPRGERAALGDGATNLRSFIKTWEARYAAKYELAGYRDPDNEDDSPLRRQLGVLGGGALGRMTLEDMVDNPMKVEDWLDAEGKRRKWSAKTWNGYRDLLHSICAKATVWKRAGKPLMSSNPIASIERKVAAQPEHFRRRLDDAEAQLFAACPGLNRPIVSPNKQSKLTPAKAAAIRAELELGKKTGAAIAAAFGVSAAIVSSIKHGDIWKPESHARLGTKGTEMERRLIGAFDGGLRAGEMLRATIDHVNWRLVRATIDGLEVSGYELTLPPALTKGGKSTGKPEVVLLATPRAVAMLERRRFQLKNHPPGRRFIWGAEDGRPQKGFRRMWRALFTAAGLDWGRNKGLVWHTTRHEYISRVAESTDPVTAQESARHRRLETTTLYTHARRDRRLAAAAGISRK